MKIETLELILSLSDTLSMNKSAKVLFYSSAQSVRYTLNAAEDELGFKLFYRNKAGLLLTEKGRSFVNVIKPFVSEYNSCITELSEKGKDIIVAYDKVFILPIVLSLKETDQTGYNYSFLGCSSFLDKIDALSNKATITFSAYTEGVDYPFIQISTSGLSVIQTIQNGFKTPDVSIKQLNGKTVIIDNKVIWINRYEHLIKKHIAINEFYTDGIELALTELAEKDSCIIISTLYKQYFERIKGLKVTDINDVSIPFGFYYNDSISPDEAESIRKDLVNTLS